MKYDKIETLKYVTNKILPSVYDDSLSYSELLAKVISYLNDTITNVDEFKNFLDDFANKFDGKLIDTVEVILAEWNKSGFLQNLIDQMTHTRLDKKVSSYNTVSDMLNSDDLVAGRFAKTLGYNKINDGGALNYIILDSKPSGYSIQINNLYAKPIFPFYLTPEMFGAIGDGVTDDTLKIQQMLDQDYKFNILPNIYKSGALNIMGSNKIIEGGKINVDNNVVLFNIKGSGSNIHFKNIQLIASGYTSTAFKINSGLSEIRWTTLYENITALGFKKVVDIPGSGTTTKTHTKDGYGSENTFIGCKFYDNDIVVESHNNQSVNNMFINSSLEHEREKIYPEGLLLKLSAGGFTFFGCSIITHKTVLDTSYDYPTPYSEVSFQNCRFEFLNGCTFIKGTGSTNTHNVKINVANSNGYAPQEYTFADVSMRGSYNVDNFNSSDFYGIVKTNNILGVTISSLGQSFTSFISNRSTLKFIEPNITGVTIKNTPLPLFASANIGGSLVNRTIDNSSQRSPVVMKTFKPFTGNRIGSLKMYAPLFSNIAEYGIYLNDLLPSETPTISLYAIPDTMNFDTINTSDPTVKLLGSFTVASNKTFARPTNELGFAVGTKEGYKEGKIYITTDSAPVGNIYVKYE